MTADELKNLLPKEVYPDLLMLVQDIQRALRAAFPAFKKIERDFPPFQVVREPGKLLDAMISFRPDESGKGFYIRIVVGKVDSVVAVDYKPGYWF